MSTNRAMIFKGSDSDAELDSDGPKPMPEDIANKNDNEKVDGPDVFHHGSHEDPRNRDAHGSREEGSWKEASVNRRNERRESDEEEFTDEGDSAETEHGLGDSSESNKELSEGEEISKHHKSHPKSLATLARDVDAEVLELKAFLTDIYASLTQGLAKIVIANNRLATIYTQLQELENLAAKAERREEKIFRKRRTAVETEY
ncbi:MAG: hypothetical protein Q9205_006819 [Flavoplaca limonia]